MAGDSWHVTNTAGSFSAPAHVPGTVHTALNKAGLIDDPYYRFNELDYEWVALDDWTWSHEFMITDQSLLSDNQAFQLEFESIDTVGDVVLNGHSLGHVADMHDGVIFKLAKEWLFSDKPNSVEVRLVSPLAVARASSAAYPYSVPLTHFHNVWDDNDPTGSYQGNESSARNFVRKTSSDFGWDWGPAFIPQGIIGDVSLVAFQSRLEPNFVVHQDHAEDGSVTLTFTVGISSTQEQTEAGSLELSVQPPKGCDGPTLTHSLQIDHLKAGWTSFDLKVKVDADDKCLWWPAGYGQQFLYISTVSFTDAKQEMQSETSRLGLRTARLVTDPVPPNKYGKTGETFYFEINGVEVYAKGANWIPADAFARDTEEDWKWLLGSGKDANMNMIRVWGGGKFMPDAFYETCDELGLMVWQEMMFGCALYPTDEKFLGQIRSEVKDVVTRLNNHPSIVIWGGNNENEGALHWYKESQDDLAKYQADYVKLYIDTVYATLKEFDPELILQASHNVSHTSGGRAWVDASPSNGILSQNASDKRWENVGDWEYGDVHYYNYNADCEDFSTYPEARFVSEHGFQSWPAFTTLETVTAEQDWSRDSTWFAYRQRHADGNQQMMDMMAKHFPVPAANASDAKYSQQFLFDTYLYLTQVQQARCYETAIGQWRRLSGDPLVKTMGVLYWQMNDIWQGPSWSSMEFDGRWRVVQYAVQRAFAQQALTSYEQDDVVHIHLTSDFWPEAPSSVDFVVSLHAWKADTAEPAAMLHFSDISIEPVGSTEIAALPVADLLESKGLSRDEVFLRFDVLDQQGSPIASMRRFHWLTTFVEAQLPPASQKIEKVEVTGQGTADVTVTSTGANAFVLLETSGGAKWAGKFSENAFTMLPGESRVVTFTARHGDEIQMDELESKLKLRSLADALLVEESEHVSFV